jgi:hypothetical protein
MQSLTVHSATDFTSGDLTTAILLCQQIPVQIHELALNGDGSLFEPFVLDMFLQSTCAKEVTLLMDGYNSVQDKAVNAVRRLLRFPHVRRVSVCGAFLLFLVKGHNITDERLCVRELQVFNPISHEDLPFLFSRLDDTSHVTVTFRSFRLRAQNVVTAQQIINFCAIVVSNFSSRPSCLLGFFYMEAMIDTSVDYPQPAINAVDKMLEALHCCSGKVVMFDRQTLSVIREWECK